MTSKPSGQTSRLSARSSRLATQSHAESTQPQPPAIPPPRQDCRANSESALVPAHRIPPGSARPMEFSYSLRSASAPPRRPEAGHRQPRLLPEEHRAEQSHFRQWSRQTALRPPAESAGFESESSRPEQLRAPPPRSEAAAQDALLPVPTHPRVPRASRNR